MKFQLSASNQDSRWINASLDVNVSISIFYENGEIRKRDLI